MRGLIFTLLLFLSCATSPTGTRDATLQSTDGTITTASDLLATSEATVFVFWSAQCSCVKRYQQRVDTLASDWTNRGINVIQVSSNAGEDLDSLRKAQQSRNLTRPLWRDEGGHLARQLGARTTPSVVLVRRDGKVLYRGWIDNERQPGNPARQPWLERALQAFVSGGSAPSRSPTWGCAITRSLSASLAGGGSP